MSELDIRTHEVTFCSRVSKWADSLFESNPALPFEHTEIEESKGIKRKRSDLRVCLWKVQQANPRRGSEAAGDCRGPQRVQFCAGRGLPPEGIERRRGILLHLERQQAGPVVGVLDDSRKTAPGIQTETNPST